MSRPMIRIHDIETDEIIDREMNDEEFAQYEARELEKKAEEAEAKAKEIAKLAILDRIGLTADELKTILG
jgi:hypothetical protein